METWTDRRDEVLIEAQAEERIAEQQRKTHATKTSSLWLQTALEKGARVAHRWTTQTITSAQPTDYQNSTTPQQSMQARTEEWRSRWNMDTEARHILLRQLHSLRQQALSTTPRNWTAESVRHTLSSMNGNRARGVDGWTLNEILRLPKKAIEGLAGVVQAVEESLALPTQICVNVVALLANQMELEKSPSRSQSASTPYTWLATKMRRDVGTMTTMGGKTL